MKVINHRLADAQGQVVRFEATGNQAGFVRPIYLIIHYTAGTSMQAAVSWLQNKHAKASAHLIIDRDGTVVQMVPFNKVAWHAGKSRWGELSGLNQDDPIYAGQLASAYACKYAETQDDQYKVKSLLALERARSLSGADAQLKAAHDEYAQRILHRLHTREIIDRDEFYQRYPNGWTKEGEETP